MASANRGKAAVIYYRLGFLKDQKDQFINAVGLYVNRIITTADSWIQGGDNNLEYRELSQMIDAAAEVLCEKCGELADRIQLKPVSAKTADIEETNCYIRNIAENVADEQSDIGQQNTESVCKLSELDKTNSSGFRQVTEQISDNSDRQGAEDQGQKTKLESLERQLQNVVAAHEAENQGQKTKWESLERQLQNVVAAHEVEDQGQKTKWESLERQLQNVVAAHEAEDQGQKTKLESLEKQLQNVVAAHEAEDQGQKTKLESLEKQLQNVVAAHEAEDQGQKTKLESLEKQLQNVVAAQEVENQGQKTKWESLDRQLQNVVAAQDRLEVEMKSQAELIAKLVDVPSQLASVKENVDVLDGRIRRIVDDSNTTFDEIETITRQLTEKVIKNTQTVEVLSVRQDNNMILLKELETKLQALKEDYGRNVKLFKNQAENGKANLAQVIQTMAFMSLRLHQLEMHCSRTRCGFSAETLIAGEVADNIIRQYEITHANSGDNFDAGSGIFTAPVDGLYVASISLLLSENEELRVAVKYRQYLEEILSTTVCESSVMAKHTTSSSVGVIAMKNMLFSSVYKMDKNVYGKMVSFSCFLLG